MGIISGALAHPIGDFLRMPTYIRQLTPDGLLPVNYHANSLADAGQYEPVTGIYTVTNTYFVTRVLKFDAHLDRMENSARLANIPLHLNRLRLRNALREMILASGFGDVRFRVTVGADAPEVFIITLEPFVPPSADVIAHGVACMTIPNSARENPLIKSTQWMHERDGMKKSDAYEILLLDENGAILEGTGSNFYAIDAGILHTAGEGVLGGIARTIVLEIAPAILPVSLSPVMVDDVMILQEAFITSSSRGIIPVVSIDGQMVGDGQVGKTTQRLQNAYVGWVADHLEEL
jgi:branched-subunit amino acid aminotransferase/4-amino-4-deoxychorismate lyase